MICELGWATPIVASDFHRIATPIPAQARCPFESADVTGVALALVNHGECVDAIVGVGIHDGTRRGAQRSHNSIWSTRTVAVEPVFQRPLLVVSRWHIKHIGLGRLAQRSILLAI